MEKGSFNEEKNIYLFDIILYVSIFGGKIYKWYKENNETVAWIKVNNTNIEYPIVRAKDNEFYLMHSFNKKIIEEEY